jgi:hypothetical protein
VSFRRSSGRLCSTSAPSSPRNAGVITIGTWPRPPKAPLQQPRACRVVCAGVCVVSCRVWWYPGMDVGGADQGSHDVVHERVLLELVVLDVDWRAWNSKLRNDRYAYVSTDGASLAQLTAAAGSAAPWNHMRPSAGMWSAWEPCGPLPPPSPFLKRFSTRSTWPFYTTAHNTRMTHAHVQR